MAISGSSLRGSVLAARERLRSGREKIRLQHEAGSPGVQISARLTDLADEILLQLWKTTLEEAAAPGLESQLAVVAHGGYGRRDLAPFSDVDLMILTRPGASKAVTPVAGQFSRDIVDAGLHLGFTVRTAGQACGWAWKDPTVFSSLAESRLLSGSVHVFGRFFKAFRQGAIRRHSRLLSAVDAARREERSKWGETNYLLRPNVKRSRGALRDIQLIRWVGFACYGEADLEQLVRLGDLPADDYRRLRAAHSFLLRLRNELHFLHGKNQDVLDRPTQMKIAQRWSYGGDQGLLPVERFMQDYFEHTRNVRYAASHFIATARNRPLLSRSLDRLLSRSLDRDIRIGPYHIWVNDRVLPQFAADMPSVLRLMNLSNEHRRRIAHRTWQEIRQAMLRRPPTPPDAQTAERFLSLLSHPGRLGALLRRLHELRVLEQIVPAMKRARGLLQFNEYHKFTVDAHAIRAVEAATNLEGESGLIADIYRRIEDKRLLHLTLLIHDLGKGFEEDHSEVGRRIAHQTGQLLNLEPDSIELMARLVHQHLLMNHTAFRHDLSDSDVVRRFGTAVGSLRFLEMLTVHSLADLTAVGPGVLTDWKQRLLEELYVRTRQYLISGTLPSHSDPETEAHRREVEQRLRSYAAPLASFQVLADMPPLLLQREPVPTLADQLLQVGTLDDAGTRSICWHRYLADQDATEYTLVRRQGPRPIGTFARATGALTGHGLEILRAEIDTLGPDVVWDVFVVRDPDFQGPPPPRRMEEISQAVCNAVNAQQLFQPSFRRFWKGPSSGPPAAVQILPTRVTFDNDTFDRYTVLSLFSYDRPGLLFAVAQALAEAQIVLHFAKISTHLDQVADIFYVTELDGSQLRSPQRQRELERLLLKAIADRQPT